MRGSKKFPVKKHRSIVNISFITLYNCICKERFSFLYRTVQRNKCHINLLMLFVHTDFIHTFPFPTRKIVYQRTDINYLNTLLKWSHLKSYTVDCSYFF